MKSDVSDIWNVADILSSLIFKLLNQPFADFFIATFFTHLTGSEILLFIRPLKSLLRKTPKSRMADIDAPETTQPFGLESKEHLMSLIKDKEVQITVRETDKYGRQVAFVYIDGQDINLKMIQSGMAWWYEKYGPDNVEYKEAQEKAKSGKVGLWSKSDAVAPWVWRGR